jgi:FMN reductase [NAD(P)H]
MSENQPNDNKSRYPNETIKLLLGRSSCRNFTDQKIPKGVLRTVLEAGAHSASGGNLQPFSIVKIENNVKKQKMAKMCGQSFIGKAPVLLLFCLDLHRLERWARLEVAPFTASSSFLHFWVSFQDTIICAQSICTAADSMGLGSVYIGTVIEMPEKLQGMFKLPKGVFPVVLLCLGYPAVRQKVAGKLDVDVFVHSEQYCDLEDEQLLAAYNKKYNNVRLPITQERLKAILKVCRHVHGEEFAEKCAQKINQDGFVNRVQQYFGLHYRADMMAEGNEKYLRVMEQFGFGWFKKYHLLDASTPT